MKNSFSSLLVGAALSLAACVSTHAMSELVSISFEPEWPASSEPGNVILYKVTTVTRAGQGLLEVFLSCQGLPEGTTVSFSPSPLRFTGREPTIQTSIMTVTTPIVMPTDIHPFIITGQAQRETRFFTNQPPADFKSAPNTQPVLLMDVLDQNNLKLRGTGASGQTYQIESTTDLANPNWTTVGSSTADGNGRFTLFIQDSQDAPMRFFRAVYLAPAAISQQ
jgi:hypothetical protein